MDKLVKEIEEQLEALETDRTFLQFEHVGKLITKAIDILYGFKNKGDEESFRAWDLIVQELEDRHFELMIEDSERFLDQQVKDEEMRKFLLG